MTHNKVQYIACVNPLETGEFAEKTDSPGKLLIRW